jgi:predicted esterase
MPRRRAITALCVLALAASACGSAPRTALSPAALTEVPAAADGDVVARRMAFAPERYRTPTFETTASFQLTYATKPHLVNGLPVTLQLDMFRPANDVIAARPLIVWVHGGGFSGGNRESMAGVAQAYARLGYVTATISYRLDSGNQCLQVQAGLLTGQQLITERARCERAILGARDDAASAVAWLRANAVTFGIDPSRVAIGGASAGAITAIHVGQTLNTPGGPAPADVQVSAVLAMSGCNYIEDSIDAADAPVALLASGGDPLVPFACTVATAEQAIAVGTPVMRHFYELESSHAQGIYGAHQAEVDRAWRLFLIDHLELI